MAYNNEIHPLTILETRRSKSRYPHSRALSGATGRGPPGLLRPLVLASSLAVASRCSLPRHVAFSSLWLSVSAHGLLLRTLVV